jgi:phytoene/squalene synthetase
MQKFSVSEKMFELKENNHNLKQLVKFSVDRTQILFDEGKRLLDYLSGRVKLEIAWTIKGGEMILNKIRKSDYDVINNKPVLSKVDYISLLLKTFF